MNTAGGLVARLARAPDSKSGGCGFNSYRACQDASEIDFFDNLPLISAPPFCPALHIMPSDIFPKKNIKLTGIY